MIKSPKKSAALLHIIRNVFTLFYQSKKRDLYFLLLIIFLSSAIEFFSFSALIPVMYLINDTSFIMENDMCRAVYTHLHFTAYPQFIFFLLLCLVLLFVLKNQFLLFAAYRLNKFSYSVALNIVERQITNFYKTNYLDIKSNNSVEYLRSLLEAPLAFAQYLMIPAIYILNELLIIVMIMAGLLLFKPAIVLLILFTMLPASYLLLYMAKSRLQQISTRKGMLESESYLETMEGINGYSDIKLFDKEEVFIGRVKHKFSSLFDINIRRNVYLLVPRRIIEVLVILIIFVIYGLASFVFKFTSRELVLLLITFATAAYRLLPSLNEIFTNIVNIRTWEFIFDLLDVIKSPEPGTGKNKWPALSFNDKIVMKDIFFKYKEHDKEIIHGLNLTVQKGEIIVLSGESGMGKTTVAKLLAGFIRPDSGTISIDGAALVHLDQVKKILAYVTQDFYLFDKTVVENIAVGEDKDAIDMNNIHRILAAVELSGFISSLPLGVLQPVGEMGSKMSGGERQRLALARALYKKAQILILDEATSSLDKENEQNVLDTIYSIAKKENITVIIISHRASAIHHFDAKYELADGQLKILS